MNILEYIHNNITYLDGGMGTLLQERGLKPGELPERWNVTHKDDIVDIQAQYYRAGTNIIAANTFGANSLKYDDEELKQVIEAAIDNAREARKLVVNELNKTATDGTIIDATDDALNNPEKNTSGKYISLDIGPMGKLLKPYGDFEFEEAVKVYGKTIKIGAAYGVDAIYIETMNDSLDAKAALLAAKENCNLPVIVSCVYDATKKTMTGTSPEAMIAMLEGMGADVIGINCSLGPKDLKGAVEDYIKYASVPVMLKPNAGLPRSEGNKTVFDVLPEEFGTDVAEYIKAGVRVAGGCCGTTPAHIKSVVEKSENLTPVPITDKNRTVISSYNHAVEFKDKPILIGERINPTGKKKFKEALRNNDIDYILSEGLTQQEKGVHVLDVNVGLPEIDEVAMLKKVSFELQAIIDLPLQIDTTDIVAMEAALRQYNGKAMINSVNGKEEVMAEVFPLVKKYGGLVVCLTLDEDGIPESAEKRVEIAKKIIETAQKYGIQKKDLIFDTLAMTVSADKNAALATLKSLRTIRYELGCHTSLGVSNVSFGLPNREIITAGFFMMALENGLSAAIMNPNSAEMMKVYYSYKALKGLDDNCTDYIENIGKYASTAMPAGTPVNTNTNVNVTGAANGGNSAGVVNSNGTTENTSQSDLQRAIIKGLKEQAAKLTVALLDTREPLDIVTQEIIPALDIVGIGFEKKTMYLPQLLMSAESAQSAFEQIKKKMADNPGETVSKGKFVIATVKGDIHDIGKNIVKLILENYGFTVFDLGKDVPPEVIVDCVIKEDVPFVGLSALMTTTVPAMEETIKQLREKAPWAKVVVGGAVLTQEYADQIGADFYAKDAMATVRYALG